jgi:uncharacterized membrane protein
MSPDAPLQAIVAAFPDEDGAADALKDLRSLGSDVLGIKEAAVLVRDAGGKLDIRESHHVGTVRCRAGPPERWADCSPARSDGSRTVGGAAVGALAARLRDSGLPDERSGRWASRSSPAPR